MIPGDLLSACPHRQFHTLPGLLESRAALPNSNPNACMPMQGGSLYHFYDGLVIHRNAGRPSVCLSVRPFVCPTCERDRGSLYHFYDGLVIHRNAGRPSVCLSVRPFVCPTCERDILRTVSSIDFKFKI